MLIAVDGNEANVKNRVGSNIYAYELLKQFYQTQNSKLKSQNQNLNVKTKFTIYLKNEPLPDLPAARSWWCYRVLKPGKLWTQWRLPLDLYLSRPRPDIFFSPGHYGPRWCPVALVVSVLDLSYIFFPDMFRKADLFQLRRWTGRSIRRARKIFTISQASKDAIIKYYRLPADKVVVTYPGIKLKAQSSKVKTTTQMSKLKDKYGIKDKFILYVGTLQPRKNLVRLIEGFNLAMKQLNNETIKLVIVGKKGWLYEEIFTKVKKLGLESRVIFTGFVPDEELPAFYEQAQCLVLVSLYEGFGLPVLEAMHYGCPVVASNVSSLPEIVGEAGVLVDPENVDEITAGIQEAMKNKKELAKKSQEQAKKFSWKKCSQETLEVLENAAKSG